MKHLFILLLLSFRLSAQTKLKLPASSKDSGIATLWSSGPTYGSIGFREGNTSVMMSLQDGTFKISGDSLSAIKLLWKYLHEANERESRLWRQYGKSQQALIKLANDWKKANEQLKKDLERIKLKQ